MPRPEKRWVTFEIDGREVSAPENSMLVDAAKHGDVEIPVFCYEPKLGQPVGACRMCLVEIEGIPKLQAGCATPVKDGMVVSTLSDKVKAAQEAVVEFLLVNHPLDCPVCDKGGECPLQDITMGWGPGRSRFIEPKRHFKKPLELSPLVAIDRERCILCYRCVRFSQEVSEDYQLVFLDRGDHSFVGTHDGHPYVAPFSGNILDLCPVGALTSTAYRFRARPWDVEGAGTVCTMCPSQCNVELTVRDDARVLRVVARDNPDVDDGWLCDRGRFGYQSFHSDERITAPMVNEGGSLREVSWEKALSTAAGILSRAGERTGAIAGGAATNEEGLVLGRLVRGLGSPHVDSRRGAAIDPDLWRALSAPELSLPVWDVDNAGSILVLETELVEESPILDLRVRKAVRRNGARLVVATSRPGSLDPSAASVVRFDPGASEAAIASLAAALGAGAVSPIGGESDAVDHIARRAGADAAAVREAAALLAAGGPVAVIWGERLTSGDRGNHAARALLALARALDVAGTEGAGLVEVPAETNARGLRETGCVPGLGPGLAPAEPGEGAAGIARLAAGGGLSALLLLEADPLRTHPDRGTWERALDAAEVIAVSQFMNESARQAAVVFPAEAYAEKDGTVTHPDGRLQRVRQALGRAGEVRPGWAVLAELEARAGSGSDPGPTHALPAVSEAVPFYPPLAEIDGRGVRWQEQGSAASAPRADIPDERLEPPPERPQVPAGALRLGLTRSLWAAAETEHSPVLRFLEATQRVELAPEDAGRLGVSAGDRVLVSQNGTSVEASVALRAAVPAGRAFLVEATREHAPNRITGDAVEVRKA